MHVKVVTLRYQEGVQGFSEGALREATAGREVLEVREHFFVHGNVPHLAVVLLPGDGATDGGLRARNLNAADPEESIPEVRRPVYRDLKRWRDEHGKADGKPAYAIARNVQFSVLSQDGCPALYGRRGPVRRNNNNGFRLFSTVRPGHAGSHPVEPANVMGTKDRKQGEKNESCALLRHRDIPFILHSNVLLWSERESRARESGRGLPHSKPTSARFESSDPSHPPQQGSPREPVTLFTSFVCLGLHHFTVRNLA